MYCTLGVHFSEWYEAARGELLVNAETPLNNHLVEFIDHDLVRQIEVICSVYNFICLIRKQITETNYVQPTTVCTTYLVHYRSGKSIVLVSIFSNHFLGPIQICNSVFYFLVIL